MRQPGSKARPFEEREAYEKGFAAFYAAEILPELVPLEAKRRAARGWALLVGFFSGLFKALLVMLAVLFLVAAFTFFAWLKLSPSMIAFLSVVFFPSILSAFVLLFVLTKVFGGLAQRGLRRAYRLREGDVLLPKIAKFYGYTYTSGGIVMEDTARASHIIPTNYLEAGIIQAKDEIFGSVNGVEFGTSRLNLYTSSGKQADMQFVVLELHRQLAATLVVTQSTEHLPLQDLQEVRLEGDFDRSFQVFANDQIEARVFLSPDVMQNLKAIAAALTSKSVRLSVVNDKVFIDIETTPEKLITLDPRRSLYDTEDVHTYLAFLNGITSMIGLLKIKSRQS